MRQPDSTVPPGGDSSPADLFREQSALVERIIERACRRNNLRGAEAEDFAGTVRLKLIEDDYAVLRKFEGQSKLTTYLRVVIQRLFLDLLRTKRGRPRPSAEAQRLGPVAVRLERLLLFDGFGFDEACRILRDNERVDLSPGELAEIAGRLPPRVLERRHEGGERVDRLTTDIGRPDEAALRREEVSEDERVARTLASVLAQLDPEDRLILRMLYTSGLSVADVSRTLGLDQKRLYRRRDRLLKKLQRDLADHGIQGVPGWWS